jgi:hypothetical protein
MAAVESGCIVAVAHEHQQYQHRYFLGVVHETPAKSGPEDPLRVQWLEAPHVSRAGCNYMLEAWIDECVRQRPLLLVSPPPLASPTRQGGDIRTNERVLLRH